MDIETSTKAHGTPVTEADRAVEHLLRQMLDSEVPGDALLGEEFGRLGDSERLWILDPWIDVKHGFGHISIRGCHPGGEIKPRVVAPAPAAL